MSELPWLSPLLEQCQTQLRQGNLAHGLLLVGRNGDGLAQLGIGLAQTLLCTEPKAPCGQCKSCLLFQAGTHPDYFLLEPEGKSETIKVDPIRKTAAFMYGTAQQGGNKVIRLARAERMNNNAANALLKVLEEPARDSFLILEAESLSRLLPTVRSRCRILKLASPHVDTCVSYLQGSGIAQPEWAVRLMIAAGAPLTAAQLSKEQITRWQEQNQAFLTQYRLTELAGFLTKQPAAEALGQLLLWVEEGIRQHYPVGSDLSGDEQQLVNRLKQCSLISLFRFRDYILELVDSLNRQANLNQQLWSEQIAARWLELTGQV